MQEIGSLVYDNVRLWRVKNQVNVLEKASKLVKAHNLDVDSINLKILVPLLQNASLEEDDALQDKWAAMLANAATKNLPIEIAFPKILAELSSLEVKVLDWLYVNKQTTSIDLNTIERHFELEEGKLEVPADNFLRLGIWERFAQYSGYPEGEAVVGRKGETLGYNMIENVVIEPFDDEISFTILGRAFVRACTFPKLETKNE
ncbi:MAG: hypothetical protein ACREGA_02350 [Candidatus Saccharimonadales bacterium]